MIKKIKQCIGQLLKTRQERRHALVGDGKLWKMKRDFQLEFLLAQGLKKEHRFMDIGCGTLRGGIPVIDYLHPGNYYGIEVREQTLLEARKELKEAGLEHKHPQLINFKDFSTIELGVSFDLMFAFSVLIHMEDKIAGACFQFVSKVLNKDGIFFANVNIGDYKDGRWQGFPVVFRTLDFYKNLAHSNGLHLETIGSIKSLGHDTGKASDKQQIMLKITKQ